jgi:hypothetical protein
VRRTRVAVGAVALALALAPMSACAWQNGEPFGAVTVDLTARWTDDASRGGAWQKLASDFEVQVTAASATFGALALVDVGTAALNFDPADPPPGYSLCHNGHCHNDDGRLVSYEEIAAELAGGDGPASALSLAVGARELRTGVEETLGCDGGPCDLPLASIRRVELPVLRLEAAGQVRDTRTPPRVSGEVAWTLVLERADDAAPATGAIDLPVDRAHPPRIVLAVGARPTVALLDGVRFELATVPDWAIASDPDSITSIHAELDELALETTASRKDD